MSTYHFGDLVLTMLLASAKDERDFETPLSGHTADPGEYEPLDQRGRSATPRQGLGAGRAPQQPPRSRLDALRRQDQQDCNKLIIIPLRVIALASKQCITFILILLYSLTHQN